MARLLLATTQAPIPPRNGVTLGPAALLRGLLGRGHAVDVAWLRPPDGEETGAAETRDAGATVHEVAVRVRPGPARVLGELFGGRPAFDRWVVDADLSAPPRPDVIWAAHRACLGPALALRDRWGWQDVPVVAGVNDIWTGVLDRRRRGRGVGALASGLRRPVVRRAEARLLGRADVVTVQSRHDARVAVDELGLPSSRVRILSNGAPDALFALPLDRSRQAVGWVGDTRGAFYASAARRLSGAVWPRIRERHDGAALHLYGPGTDRLADEAHGVRGLGFVERIEDVYGPLSVLVAPVFKGHGRINKVVEAMAAGVPVVGDATAFHGLEDFEAGRHGVVVNDWDGFAPAVAGLLSDAHRRMDVAREARILAESHFRWKDRVDVVERWLLEPRAVGAAA